MCPAHESRNDRPSRARELALAPLSRRAFFGLTAAVGALTLVGTAGGGRIMAFADEAGNVFFAVYILSKEEVPIMVYDVSGGKYTPLKGASVTITTLLEEVPAADKSVTVVTDESGFAPARVRKLSMQRDKDDAKRYNFWGSIEMKLDGYREFAVHDYYVEAGTPTDADGNRPNVINIPTQPVNGEPYLRQFTIDGVDIQYSRGVEAKVWKGNDYKRDLVAEVVTPKPNTSVDLAVLVNGVQKAAQTLSSDASGHAKFTFNDSWCKDTEVGSAFSVKWTADGKTRMFQSPMACTAPIMPRTAAGDPDVQGEDVPYSPGTGAHSKDQVTEYRKIPGWLGRRDDSLNLAFPFFPISLFFDSSGRFGIALTLGSVDFLKSHTAANKRDVTRFACSVTGVSENKMWDTYKAGQQELRENLGKAYGSSNDPKLAGMSPAVSNVNFKLTADLVGVGEIVGEKTSTTDRTRYAGDLVVRLTLALTMDYTRQMQAGWIPFFVTFDFTMSAAAEFATGIKFYDKFKDLDYHYSGADKKGGNYNFVISLRQEAGLTLGLGVSGIASIAGRGFAYITWEFTFPCPAQLPAGKKNPHSVVKIGANVQAIIQVFFFKKVYQVTRFEPATLKDNWKDNEADDVIDTRNLLDDDESEIGYEDFTAEDVVSDADIAGEAGKSVEARGTWSVENGAFGAECPAYGLVASSVSGSNELFADPAVFSPYEGAEHYLAYNEVGGLKPVKQTPLYSDVFSNPRIRIVHTDTESFKQDRAFMVRVLAVQIDVPHSTAAFAQTYDANGAAQTAYDLRIDELDGNTFVEVTDTVTTENASQAVANSIGKVTRTRLVVNEWDKLKRTWEDGVVLDFTCEGEVGSEARLNSYDLDFEVDLHAGGLLIAVTSLLRPKESYDAGSNSRKVYLDHEKRQYVSVLRYDIDKKAVVAAGTTYRQLDAGLSLFHPHILVQSFDEGDGKGATDHCVVYSYAVEYAEDGLSRKSASLAATVFDDVKTGTSNHRFCPPTRISCADLSGYSADALLEGNFLVSCPDPTLTVYDSTLNRAFTTVLIAWSHPKTRTLRSNRSHVFLQSFSVMKRARSAGGEGENAVEYESSVKQHSTQKLEGVPSIAKLGRMKQRGVFSYPEAPAKIAGSTSDCADPRTLKMVTVDLENLTLGTLEDVGTTDKTQYFASFNGRRLYCVRTMNTEDLVFKEGSKDSEVFKNFGSPGMSEEAVSAVKDGGRFTTSGGPYNTPLDASGVSTANKPVRMFQLLEARWVKELGTYYDFYPIAQVDYEPDNIGVIAASKKYTHFTFAALSTKGETATVVQVDVPVNLAAKLYFANPVLPFAAPGDNCWYVCEIANWGNAPITSITMRVTFGDGTEFEGSEMTFDDLSQHMLPASEDVKPKKNEAGEYELDEYGVEVTEEARGDIPMAGILWPGRRRAFKFYFKVPKIPESETGKVHKFKISVSGVADKMEEVSNRFPDSSLASLDDASSLPLLAEDAYVLGDEGEPFAAPSILNSVPEELELEISDSISGTYEMGAADYTLEGSGGTGGSDGSSAAAAKTGDSGLLGLVGAAALGAAAYGAKRYSERRLENEAAAAAAAARTVAGVSGSDAAREGE